MFTWVCSVKNIAFCLVGTLALASCTTTEIKSSSPQQIVIKADHRRTSDAYQLAEHECQKYDKSARLNQSVAANVAWGTLFFDCE